MAWNKRTAIPFTCPSGNVVMIRRPGPSLSLKGTKALRIFERGGKDVLMDVQKQLAYIESLPDNELDEIYNFARIMLADSVVTPRLYLNPNEEQLSPDDIPLHDFWALFGVISNGVRDMPVTLKDGETTVDAVETFPEQETGSPESGSDSEVVQ